MSDQEKFLTRWSRRKRDTANEDAQPDKPAAIESEKPSEPGHGATRVVAGKPPAEPRAPEFDLTKLPSLESISANSDLTAFFQPGVPSALKHAALRRAWAVDPAIRDFVGLAENGWDFTDPEAMAGFGALDPKYDVKKIIAEIFREVEPDAKLSAETPASPEVARLPDKPDTDADISAANEPAKAEPQQVANSDSSNRPQRHEDGAMQQNDSNESFESVPGIKPRRHGSAVPR